MSRDISHISETKLRSSIYTMWSLFVLIDQHYHTLFRYRDLLEQDFELANDDEVYLDTIYEAVVYQIFLKTCSFIEEWDTYFGVETESEYIEDVKIAKQIAKPARKQLNHWKGLREFRNQAVAHNHRDKNGKNIYVINKKFHIPWNLEEIALMIFCIEKMVKISSAVFQEEWAVLFQKGEWKNASDEHVQYLNQREMTDYVNHISTQIRANFTKYFPTILDVTSIYGGAFSTQS